MKVLAVLTSIMSALSFSDAEITCLTYVNRTNKFCREQTVRLVIKVDAICPKSKLAENLNIGA